MDEFYEQLRDLLDHVPFNLSPHAFPGRVTRDQLLATTAAFVGMLSMAGKITADQTTQGIQSLCDKSTPELLELWER